MFVSVGQQGHTVPDMVITLYIVFQYSSQMAETLRAERASLPLLESSISILIKSNRSKSLQISSIVVDYKFLVNESSKQIPLSSELILMISSKPINAPPQINKIWLVSI